MKQNLYNKYFFQTMCSHFIIGKKKSPILIPKSSHPSSQLKNQIVMNCFLNLFNWFESISKGKHNNVFKAKIEKCNVLEVLHFETWIPKKSDYWVLSSIMVGDLQKYIYKLVYEIEPPYAWKKHLSRPPLCGLL